VSSSDFTFTRRWPGHNYGETSSSSDFTFIRRWPGHNYGEFAFQWFHIHQEVARSQLRSVSSSDFTFTRRWPGHNYGECVFQWFYIHKEVARSQLGECVFQLFHIHQEVAKSQLQRVRLPVISHSPGGGQVTITESSSSSDFTFTRRWPGHIYGEFVFLWLYLEKIYSLVTFTEFVFLWCVCT
jgi:hypothetical protein